MDSPTNDQETKNKGGERRLLDRLAVAGNYANFRLGGGRGGGGGPGPCCSKGRTTMNREKRTSSKFVCCSHSICRWSYMARNKAQRK